MDALNGIQAIDNKVMALLKVIRHHLHEVLWSG